jgi:hypothetical protein
MDFLYVPMTGGDKFRARGIILATICERTGYTPKELLWPLLDPEKWIDGKLPRVRVTYLDRSDFRTQFLTEAESLLPPGNLVVVGAGGRRIAWK